MRGQEDFHAGAGRSQDFHGVTRDAGGRRPHHANHAMACGKRGAVNTEPAAGSPRKNARLRDQASQQQQQPVANSCPFAITRRCSFVERRAPAATAQMPFNRGSVDSWEPSCIEPGAFPSVGSAIEVTEGTVPPFRQPPPHGHARGNAGPNGRDGRHGGYGHTTQADENEPPHAPRNHFKDPPAHQLRLRNMAAEVDEKESAELLDPRDYRYGNRPAATPVRQGVSMGVQANDKSILRDTRPKYTDASAGEDSPQAEHRVLRDSNGQNSDRSHMTGKSGYTVMGNFSVLSARGGLRDMKYPARDHFIYSATTDDMLKKAATKVFASHMTGKAAVAQALSCAVLDECQEMDVLLRDDDDGSKGGVEKRVAEVLKKMVTKAEKKCMRESLAVQSAPGLSVGSASHEDTDVAVHERCAEIEAQLATADRRIAEYREALQRPVPAQESEPLAILADLSARLSAIHRGPEEATPLPSDFTNNMDKTIQGLVAVNASCRHILQQCLDEKESLQERNREFCPPASAAHQAPGIDSGARSILRGIR